jgi:hypothetical protein
LLIVDEEPASGGRLKSTIKIVNQQLLSGV